MGEAALRRFERCLLFDQFLTHTSDDHMPGRDLPRYYWIAAATMQSGSNHMGGNY